MMVESFAAMSYGEEGNVVVVPVMDSFYFYLRSEEIVVYFACQFAPSSRSNSNLNGINVRD